MEKLPKVRYIEWVMFLGCMRTIVLGNKISERIDLSGVSKKQLLLDTKIERRSLERMIKYPYCLPSLRTAVTLSRYFGCKVEELIEVKEID